MLFEHTGYSGSDFALHRGVYQAPVSFSLCRDGLGPTVLGPYAGAAFLTKMFRYDFGLPTLVNSFEYYKSVGFRCPVDYRDTPFQRAFNTDLGFYEYLAQQPGASKNFHTYMSVLQARSPRWVDWFPVQERIIDGFDPSQSGSDVLLIDIGGGEGHYIRAFHNKLPQAPGRLILQDLHAEKYAEDWPYGIERMKYSFFNPQPVQGGPSRVLSSLRLTHHIRRRTHILLPLRLDRLVRRSGHPNPPQYSTSHDTGLLEAHYQ